MKIAYLLGSLNRGGTETLLLDVFRNAQRYSLDAIGVYRKTGLLEQDFIQSGVRMQKLTFCKNVVSYLFRLRKLIVQNQSRYSHFIYKYPKSVVKSYFYVKKLGSKVKHFLKKVYTIAIYLKIKICVSFKLVLIQKMNI